MSSIHSNALETFPNSLPQEKILPTLTQKILTHLFLSSAQFHSTDLFLQRKIYILQVDSKAKQLVLHFTNLKRILISRKKIETNILSLSRQKFLLLKQDLNTLSWATCALAAPKRYRRDSSIQQLLHPLEVLLNELQEVSEKWKDDQLKSERGIRYLGTLSILSKESVTSHPTNFTDRDGEEELGAMFRRKDPEQTLKSTLRNDYHEIVEFEEPSFDHYLETFEKYLNTKCVLPGQAIRNSVLLLEHLLNKVYERKTPDISLFEKEILPLFIKELHRKREDEYENEVTLIGEMWTDKIVAAFQSYIGSECNPQSSSTLKAKTL